MKNVPLITLILVAVLLPGCTPDVPGSAFIPLPGRLQAWVDAPLENTYLNIPVSYTLVCHGSDPSGVQALEFSINEDVLAEVPNTDPAATLFQAAQVWEPVEPGTYTVRCRARDSSAVWGDYAAVRVHILGENGAISVLPSHTPTTTATATVTPTVTATFTPIPVGSPITFTADISTDTFQYQRDCIPDPGQVTITAQLSSTVGVGSVFLFFRLESSELGITTEWNPGEVMIPRAGGYISTISWDAIPQLAQIRGSSAVFAYQFVAVDQGQVVIARSQVFRDITLEPCR